MQPIRQRILQLRRNILTLYALTVIVVWGVILYALHIEWIVRLEQEKKELMRQASVTSSLIHDLLVDASKIVDAARGAIEKESAITSPDRHRSYEIIRSVVQNFSIYNTSDTLGLVLYLDKNGFLVAQSGIYPSPAYDLTERLYFRALRDDPSRKFALGKMRTAITTGKRVFHLSMPIHDNQGGFSGVVVCQIREKELSESLDHMLHGINTRILVQIPEDGTAYLFPSTREIPPAEHLLNEELMRVITEGVHQSAQQEGMVRTSETSKTFPETGYVGYVRDPLFGLITTARVAESELISNFFWQNECLIGLSLLASLGISILFYTLYRKALSLEYSFRDASVDHLTQLRNRRSFEKEFHRLWLDAVRKKMSITVIFMDIDRFKGFNDACGHAAGDRVLRATARVIARSLNRPLDLCCRWGGEEFLGVLPETTAEEARSVAERIRQRIGMMKLKLDGKPLPQITLSIGIASSLPQGHSRAKSLFMLDQGITPEDLIARADKALLQAKALGRDRVVIG
jgi:diguanylate cyclase (GGDEF)-like protein